MKTFLSFACLLALGVLSTQTVSADIAKPKTPDQQSKVVLRRNLEIVPDGRVWSARLQLTQSDLQELRAALDGTGGNTTVAASIAQSPTRTIIAGVLLFLSVSFAGVWLARTSAGRRSKAIAAAMLVVAVLGAAAIITRGNAGPPPGYFSWMQLSKNYSHGKTTSGDFVIEVIPDQPNRPPGVKLLIPYNPKQNGDDE
ncbi:MAG TPA: hypothetical protein VGJ37_18080 [Pyrinomonadaceae bacterium]|jgi:hypothetical protein